MTNKNLTLTGVASRIEQDGNPSNPNICTSYYADGLYHVNLNGSIAFDSSPAVMITLDTSSFGGSWTGVTSVHNVTSNSFQVSTQDSAGGNHKIPFFFACIEQTRS